MITTAEMNKIIFRDEAHAIENDDWIERFYELWMERYHALNIVKFPSDVIKLSRQALLGILKAYAFDEMHLFKIYEGANVYALLSDQGEGNWSYQFIIIHKAEPDQVETRLDTVESLKAHFDYKEPILEIPLPHDRKYVED